MRSFQRSGGDFSARGVVFLGSVFKTSVLGYMTLASSISVRNFARVGTSTSAFNFVTCASSISLRTFLSSGGKLSVLDYASLGSSMSVRSMMKMRGGASVLGCVLMGSSLSHCVLPILNLVQFRSMDPDELLLFWLLRFWLLQFAK